MIQTKQILIRILVCTATLCVATSCFKKVTTDTTLVVKSIVQQESGGENATAKEVFAYAYYTENDDWTVASYDDALNRIITDSLGVERRTVPDVEGEPYYKEGYMGNYTALPLNQSPAMVVVVSPETRMYAYLFKELNIENLPETFLTLLFHPWKTAPYTEGSASKGSMWYVFPPAPLPEGEQPGEGEGEGGSTEDGGGTENNGGGSTEDGGGTENNGGGDSEPTAYR